MQKKITFSPLKKQLDEAEAQTKAADSAKAELSSTTTTSKKRRAQASPPRQSKRTQEKHIGDSDRITYKNDEWSTVKTMEVGQIGDWKASTKIASFDFDYTLCKPKDGRKFARSGTDWEWLYPKI